MAQNDHLAVPTGDSQYVTVFNDPVNFNAKHPLNNAWTLWFDNPGKKANDKNWMQSLKELITFDTVEDFWGVYNNVVKTDQLAIGSNYHLFKQGVKPMWEDEANAHGGKWSIQLPRNKTIADIDRIWLYTMLACIGEAFESESEICGAVVSVRKAFFRIALWTRSSDKESVAMAIGRTLKQSAGLHGELEFTPHHETKTSQKWVV